MMFHHGTVLAISFFTIQHLVSAAPTTKRGLSNPLLQITTLGGLTFKINQVPNQRFHGTGKGRGAMAVARAYTKYGYPIPDDLLAYIKQLLEELGLLNPDAGNDTLAGPQGEKKMKDDRGLKSQGVDLYIL